MTTSGVTAWSMTARDIITEAMNENAILPLGESPSGAEANACLVRLNALIKSWQVGLHLETMGTLTVPSGTQSGTLEDDIENVISARLVMPGYERPLQRWERGQYLDLPNRSQTGTPIAYYVSPQRAGTVIYLWPVPTQTETIKLDYLRKPETVTDLGQTVDFPDEYQEALYANLAVRCAGLFGAQAPQELIVRAERLKREIEDKERPASYIMEAG